MGILVQFFCVVFIIHHFLPLIYMFGTNACSVSFVCLDSYQIFILYFSNCDDIVIMPVRICFEES